MTDYKRTAFGEAVKGVTTAVVGAGIFWSGQMWLNEDLEYRVVAKNGYLSAPLGQQGLSLGFNGTPLKNISVVEFGIFNRTGKQFADVDLVFNVLGPEKENYKLVSAGIITPSEMPQDMLVEELPAKDRYTRKFRLKIVPKQSENEYFHGIFVFDGDKAPAMGVASLSKDASIAAYKNWKDIARAILAAFTIFCGLAAFVIAATSFIDYWLEPQRHGRRVARFVQYLAEQRGAGKLASVQTTAMVEIGETYAEYTRPRPSRFWSRLFGKQKFEY